MGETFLDIYGNQMNCLVHCYCRNSTLPKKYSYQNCETSCCTSISNTEFKNLTKENTYFKSLAQNLTQELSNITKLYESVRENVKPTGVTSIISDCSTQNVFLGVFGVFIAIALFLLCWVFYNKRKSGRFIKQLCNTNGYLKTENTSLNATVTTQNSKIQELEDDLAAAQLAQGVGNQVENGDPGGVPIAYVNTGS